jgi:hypothetical protein
MLMFSTDGRSGQDGQHAPVGTDDGVRWSEKKEAGRLLITGEE